MFENTKKAPLKTHSKSIKHVKKKKKKLHLNFDLIGLIELFKLYLIQFLVSISTKKNLHETFIIFSPLLFFSHVCPFFFFFQTEEHEIFSPTLELLLMQDWFLVELGRKLIGKYDRDFLNVLVLNKRINKRVTPVFRQHFSDPNLQRHMKELFSSLKLEEIQRLFETNPLALNPNITTSSKTLQVHKNASTVFQCIHKREKDTVKWYRLCGCDGPGELMDWQKNQNFDLIVVALRLKFDKLVESLLFHPKTKFLNLRAANFIEV